MRKCRRCNNCAKLLQKQVERDTILRHYQHKYRGRWSSEATSGYIDNNYTGFIDHCIRLLQ